MALNISAWSIREPASFHRLFDHLLVLGWVSSTSSRDGCRAPTFRDLGRGLAVRRSTSELESQVTQDDRDGVSGVEGVRHISSSITDGYR